MQEFEDLVAQFERFQAGVRTAEDPLTRYDGMGQEIAALEVISNSPDRSVTVVAGPGGAVKDIRFTERALEQGAQGLARLVMATMQTAVAQAAREQAAIVQRYVGDDMPVLDQVLQTQAEVLGTTVEQLRSPEEPPPPSRDDDDQLRNLYNREDD